jgi:hypothetical protein
MDGKSFEETTDIRPTLSGAGRFRVGDTRSIALLVVRISVVGVVIDASDSQDARWTFTFNFGVPQPGYQA